MSQAEKNLFTSRLTSKYQATVPESVRRLLGLKKGDFLAFDIHQKKVTLRRATPTDLAFAKALENTLSEWNSPEDEAAYHNL
jgi:bifunctional DNA-binding transcriptional regulator/antitoxin component of YhaV-PrlF toxin-antitoxin module